ncbi:acyltransferase [Olivibacter domesticus]|uniref:Maltose O-acetyltransferase n=1 Tax=Olivibacter domesticus TaxID=407022 RepID=A0A1H7UWW0_OLID1|nr:acyltransferase [Olivibacter domesticus]SEM01501.1 maltose O-acetyltransferase [Olivibacter domesticus]
MKRILIKIFNQLKHWSELQRQDELRRKYNIHDSFRFNGDNILFYGDGELIIDEGSYIGSLSTIQVFKRQKVTIGKGCSISHNVRMYTCSKDPNWDFKDKKNAPDKRGNIVIEDYVWIGANVFINPGVRIGENAVVGANSVVTKDIEPWSIYGGVPAKLIRMKKINV